MPPATVRRGDAFTAILVVHDLREPTGVLLFGAALWRGCWYALGGFIALPPLIYCLTPAL